MSFRFWRRIRLAPGVTLNLSKSSASLSFGPQGAKHTISPHGNRVTAGIPGTGLFYTVKAPGRALSPEAAVPSVHSRLDLGFFKRLITPASEKSFVDGLRALHDGQEEDALRHLEDAHDTPDAAWMAGMLRLKREDFTRAEAHLFKALAGGAELGRLFATYELDTVVSLPVTPEVTAHVRPRPRGTRLALAELYQVQGLPERARPLLDRVIDEDRLDVVAVAALAELMLDADPVPRDAAEQIVRMTAVVENETPVHAAALLYKARALRVLGLHDAAVKTLTKAYRRKKDRPAELLRQIRYERALGYEAIGRKSRAHQELEAIYAEAPDFPDVAGRLRL